MDGEVRTEDPRGPIEDLGLSAEAGPEGTSSDGEHSVQSQGNCHNGESTEYCADYERGEDGVITCSPLAMVRPFVPTRLELALSGEEKEEMSVRVKRRAKGFGKFLGVSCAGFEDKIFDLLMDIERNRRSSDRRKSGNHGKIRARCSRELKQLSCSLNFE